MHKMLRFVITIGFFLLLISCDISEIKLVKQFSSEKNVFGRSLEICCEEPVTGFYRDGYCRVKTNRYTSHIVCAEMTDQFLKFSKSRGNDLTQAIPNSSFHGLKEGDLWCLDIHRWLEAKDAGVAPLLYLNATHKKVLNTIAMDSLLVFRHPDEGQQK